MAKTISSLTTILHGSYNNRKLDIIAAFILFFTFLIFYNDVLFLPELIGGIDFQIPLSNPWNYFQFGKWTEINLGFVDSDFFFYNKVFTGFIGLLSFGNQILAQKLFFAGILFSGITMYVLLRNHATQNRPVALIAAIFYMFAHYTIHGYGTGLIWEMAFVPLAINFGLNFLTGKNEIRNLLLFLIFFSLSIGFGVHALLGIPITLFVIFLVRLATISDIKARWLYFRKILLLTVFGIGLFVVMNPGVTSVFFSYLGLNTDSDTDASHVIPTITVEEIFRNYESSSVFNILTMSHWVMLSYFIEGGIVILFVALLGTLLYIRKNKMADKFMAYSFLGIFAVFAIYGLMIYYKSSLFPILYASFRFLALFRGTEGIAPFILLPTAVLLAIGLSNFVGHINRLRKPIQMKRTLSIGVLASVLIINLIYSPAFSSEQHVLAQHYEADRIQRPVPYPAVYQEIIDWLREQPDHTMYRAILLPTSFLSAIYVPLEYQYLFSPANGYQNSRSYVQDAEESLLRGDTNWGSKVAPASVRYIIVPFVSDEPKLTESTVQGEPRIWHGLGLIMNGDPQEYVSLLNRQQDITLIYNSSSFAVYENTATLPRITSFSEPIALVGDDISFSEWATISAGSNSIPLVYSSIDDVPAEFREFVYNGATNLAFDQLDVAREQFENNESPFLFRLVQSGSSLLVYIPNLQDSELGYLFNVVANGENRLTYSNTVEPRSLSILRFEASQINAEDDAVIYLADSLHKQFSNIIIWDTNKIAMSDQAASNDVSTNLQPIRVFVDSEGNEISVQSQSLSPIQSVVQMSPSDYTLHIKSTQPFYIFLGESYSDNWKMYKNSEEMPHYRPPFGNVFFVNSSGEFDVTIEYRNPQEYLLTLGLTTFVITLIISLLHIPIARFWHRLMQVVLAKIGYKFNYLSRSQTGNLTRLLHDKDAR